MRLRTLIAVFFLFTNYAIGQDTIGYITSSKDLIGKWESGKLGYSKIFKFYENGKFLLYWNNPDGKARIIGVNGKYYVKDSTLYLKIESRTEIVGGKLEPQTPGAEEEEFLLKGGKKVIIKQPNEKPSEYFLKCCKSYNERRVIQINTDLYVQTSIDPDDYSIFDDHYEIMKRK